MCAQAEPKETCFGTEILEIPQRASTDRKEYRRLRLRNGAEVLLVDDTYVNDSGAYPERKAACALAVDVGSFSDPPHVEVSD